MNGSSVPNERIKMSTEHCLSRWRLSEHLGEYLGEHSGSASHRVPAHDDDDDDDSALCRSHLSSKRVIERASESTSERSEAM